MSFTFVIDLANKLVDRPRCIRLRTILHISDQAPPTAPGYLPLVALARLAAVDAFGHTLTKKELGYLFGGKSPVTV